MAQDLPAELRTCWRPPAWGTEGGQGWGRAASLGGLKATPRPGAPGRPIGHSVSPRGRSPSDCPVVSVARVIRCGSVWGPFLSVCIQHPILLLSLQGRGGRAVTPMLIGPVLCARLPSRLEKPLRGFSREKGGRRSPAGSVLSPLSCERDSGTIHHPNVDSNLLLLPLSLPPSPAHPVCVRPSLVSNPVLTVGRQTTAPATMSTAASGTTMGLVEQGRCS